ncbi:MAG: BrnA antitoxin family protein [Candidatus Competibacter sp.]|nr:BrnA antitoxin family protein [Candidatus Competibacter sp.]
MSKRSISETLDDNPPIMQADIDNGRLILRQRKEGRVLPLKQRVNIYLDREIVEHFKQRAGGRGYQTLLNEALKQAIQQDRLEDTLRRVIREELRGRTL